MRNTIAKLLLSTAFLINLAILSPAKGEELDNQQTQAVAVDLLMGSDDIDGVRLAYRPIKQQWSNIPYFETLDVYWEMSINFWEYGTQNKHEVNYAIALSPVFSKTFHYVKGIYPLKWEFGIGLSLLEDTRFAGKDVGSHYQFEDRIGITMNFGNNHEQSVSLRYMHYSNGGLNSKNPGLDFLNFAYAYSF